jgi:hypothetical protein
MKHATRSAVTIVSLLLGLFAVAQAEPVLPPALTAAPQSESETFFPIEDRKARVDGQVIRVFVVKAEHLTVSYENRTNASIFPEYTVRLYNRYGFLIAEKEVDVSIFGGSPKLEAGDVGGDRIPFNPIPLAAIFRHSQVDLPADFGQAAWLSLADSNSELEEQE